MFVCVYVFINDRMFVCVYVRWTDLELSGLEGGRRHFYVHKSLHNFVMRLRGLDENC
jgi:hypothetical protein